MYHHGELTVQDRAGVRAQAARIGGSLHGEIPPVAAAFLAGRHFVILGAAGEDGRPWASLVTGAPGFASAPDPDRVRIVAAPLPGDPMHEVLSTATFAGLLAIDLATRRRMRANGRLLPSSEGTILIDLDQVYSNCPKYIQRRDPEARAATSPAEPSRRSFALTDSHRTAIRRADTFFIATVNPEEGADASHRGGRPGFVQVEGDRITWPDYAGNMMFNTLGNIAAYPRAGLLIPDFTTGTLLQVTGRAAIDWDSSRIAATPGAERMVSLEVEEIVELAGVFAPATAAPDFSPFNPSGEEGG